MLSMNVGAKETSEARLHKLQSLLIMLSEARQIFFEGHNISIYSMSFRQLFIS